MKFIDLFCGAGLGALGAVRGGGTPLLAIDSWDIATETYRANFPRASVITGRVENIDPTEYADMTPDILLTSYGKIKQEYLVANAVVGGSQHDPIMSVFSWIDVLHPRWIVMEHLVQFAKWYKHKKIVMDISSRGYAVSQLVIDSLEFGLPQSRRRLFIIANKNGLQITQNDLLKSIKKQSPKTSAMILDDPGVHKSTPLYKPGRSASIIFRAEQAINELGRGKSFIIQYDWPQNKMGGWRPIDGHLSTVTTKEKFALVTWANDVPMCRMLHPSELLRAMGADCHMLPIGIRKDRLRMIGEGTCAPVMEAIFRCIGDSMGYGALRLKVATKQEFGVA